MFTAIGLTANKEGLSELELRRLNGQLASDAIEMLTSLFVLLALADFDKAQKGRLAEFLDADYLTIQFTYLGQLGCMLGDSAFANIQECLQGYDRLMEEREQNLSKTDEVAK